MAPTSLHTPCTTHCPSRCSVKLRERTCCAPSQPAPTVRIPLSRCKTRASGSQDIFQSETLQIFLTPTSSFPPCHRPHDSPPPTPSAHSIDLRYTLQPQSPQTPTHPTPLKSYGYQHTQVQVLRPTAKAAGLSSQCWCNERVMKNICVWHERVDRVVYVVDMVPTDCLLCNEYSPSYGAITYLWLCC